MPGWRHLCRAGVIYAGLASFMPGERYTYQATTFLAGRPLSIQGGCFLCGAGVFYAGRAFYIPSGGCSRYRMGDFYAGQVL